MTYKCIDEFSRTIGVMECFNEMLASGTKKLALGIPVYDKQERDSHLEYAKAICEANKTKYYVEDEAFISDLFPLSMNTRKYNMVFYKEDIYLERYFKLKEIKNNLIRLNSYDEESRIKLAYDYGKLLSYEDESIYRMIEENNEKEAIIKPSGQIRVDSQITFLYFDDVIKAVNFFVDVFGFEIAIKQKEDFCVILKASSNAYLGIVDRTSGSMKATRRDGVLVSFVVKDTEKTYEILKNKNMNEISELKTMNDIKVKGFMFIGPEGYRFEVQEFLS